ncbi:MAG TPA: Gfo/Idh/MocA family oxidoreductase [Methylomirabilota bacterium]|nr:Gfo/Idh/MocA family oxidoreductase [Methylomirabilota bacterium]
MKKVTRRSFMKTAAWAAGVTALPARVWAQAPGSNSDIRVAVVGFNGRGKDHISGLSAVKGVRLVGLCDADQKVLAAEVQKQEQKQNVVQGYTDIRRMLDNKDIDVVTIGTPNHWHALGTIWACQAGKDVYVEKPVSHNVFEGRKAVEAARKYNRIVQTGTQSRSNPGMREAVEFIQQGNLGKILWVRGLCYKRRASIGKVDGPQQIPQNIDYDLWCGPSPMVPLMRKNLHYDWHWVWETGNGDLGNQGIHQMDIGRWILGEDALSPEVFSVGGRLGYVDDGTTPNTQIVFHNYKKAPLIFEVRGLPARTDAKEMDKYRGASVGVVVQCEGGYVSIPTYNSATVYDNDGKETRKFNGTASHYENFITAVRERKRELLTADILEGHLSSALCHTGNISYRLGKKASPEAIREQIKGDKLAEESFGRMAEHLAANDVDISKEMVTLGPVLRMDAASEKFTNNREANTQLTREYRKPYVVPDKV